MSESAREKLAKIYIEKYKAGIERMANAILKDWSLAEDAAQDVLIRLLDDAENKLEMPPSQFKKYIYAAAKNHAIDMLRERERRSKVLERLNNNEEFYYDHIEKEAFHDKYGFGEEIQTLLKNLDYIDKEIICLKYGEGFTFREIADALNRSEESIYKRVQRAKGKLKDLLKEAVKQ